MNALIEDPSTVIIGTAPGDMALARPAPAADGSGSPAVEGSSLGDVIFQSAGNSILRRRIYLRLNTSDYLTASVYVGKGFNSVAYMNRKLREWDLIAVSGKACLWIDGCALDLTDTEAAKIGKIFAPRGLRIREAAK